MTNDTTTLIILSLMVILVAITIHEFIHGLVGYFLGDDTAYKHGRLSLNPLAHIDPFTTIGLPLVLVLLGLPPFGAAKPVPVNTTRLKYGEFGMAVVAISGPLSNLFLAIVGGLALNVFGTLESNLWVSWWILFISINIGFCVFNLIPFPPLDGSRVLYAFAPEFIKKIMLQIEAFGLMSIVIFMFVFFPLISPLLQTVNQAILSWVI